MKRIYGITGRKGHGKDTFARMVAKYNPGFQIIHFADDLKDMAKDIWSLTDAQMNDTVLKEAKFEHPVDMDMFINLMRDTTGLPAMTGKGLLANSPRQILQYFGTDYVRSVVDSYWIDRVMSKIQSKSDHFLIPDTRFPNEAVHLAKCGGKVIKIVREDLSTDGNSSHVSESAIDAIEPDIEFRFKTGKRDLRLMDQLAFAVANGLMEAERRS